MFRTALYISQVTALPSPEVSFSAHNSSIPHCVAQSKVSDPPSRATTESQAGPHSTHCQTYLSQPGYSNSTLYLALLPTPPHPLRKLPLLLPDIHKARPRLEHLERVAHVVPADLAVRVGEAVLALALDLAGPHAPLDRAQRRRAEREAEADDGRRDEGLDGYVEREGGRGGGGGGGGAGGCGCGCGAVGLEDRVFLGRVAAGDGSLVHWLASGTKGLGSLRMC